MNRRHLLRYSGLAGAAALLSGCFWPDAEWHRKITVIVDTPLGEVRGSSVHAESVTADNTPRWLRLPEAGGAGISFQGEAVVVDLGQGRYLFALLKGPDTVLTLYPHPKDFVEAAKLVPRTKGVKILSSADYPMLVTFDNIADPKSVKLVDPSKFEASFGTGYALKSITLEITDDKVTEGKVRTIIPWISDFRNKLLDGDTVMWGGDRHTLANSLGMGSFDSN